MTNTEMKLLAAVRASWKCMCEHDGITADSKFAVFSDTNPFAKVHNVAMSKLLAYRRMLAATYQPLPQTKAVR